MPIRTPVIAGNWKMHKGPTAARSFCRRLAEIAPSRDDRTLILVPPAISLAAAGEAMGGAEGQPDLLLGIQNIHWKDEGAYTGEVSAPMARDAGASVVLVGHSERRHIFGETNEETRLKVAAALAAGLTPILCVGETLAQREAGEVEDTIIAQLDAALDGLEPEVSARCLIAYEPVWAIGTGKTATPEDAAAAHAMLRRRLDELIGTRLARGVPILYGGSVNAGNAAALIAADEVDGLLVGGASLDPESFAAIADAATAAYR
jgi:triosephosphate isomerase